MGERLYRKRGNPTWYGWYYDRSGKRKPVCLKTHDKRTASLKLRRDERQAHGEDHDAADAPPYLVMAAMGDWLQHGLVGKSAGTKDYYSIKSGHLNRLLGNHDVNGLGAEDVSKYITTRREEEKASQHTVSKEMTTLRLCLRWAHEQRWKDGGLRMVRDPRPLVPEMKSGYMPRKRFLERAEFERLADSFKRKHRRDWIVVATYTGGRDSEVGGIRWTDVDFLGGWVTLNGTKTEKAQRNIPMHQSLRAALMGMPRRKDGLVVGPWGGVVEDMRKHCLELGIEKASPNDLRRTFASWLVQAGVPLKVVAELLGHTSTAMVEKVYGHLVNDNLRDAVKLLPRRRASR